MDITQWYAAAIALIAVCCLLLGIFYQLAENGKEVSQALTKQLHYRHIIGRHALVGPWTLAFGLAHMGFFGVNIFCVCYSASDLSQIGHRGGILALINLSSLMMAFQNDRIAHALGFSLMTSRKIHQSMGLNAFLLAAIHVIIVAAKDQSVWSSFSQHPFLITAIVSTCLLAVLSWPVFTVLSYELFLWIHRALAILCLYSIWRHVPSTRTPYNIYLYATGAIVAATLVVNGAIIVTRNGLLSHGRCFAEVKSTHGMIMVRLHLSRPLKMEPGQYINLWIPSVSFWAFAQAHPFVVISWEEVPQMALDLFIQPRHGFTRNITSLTSSIGQPSSWWAMFGGPYGQTLETHGFEKVLMVANGAGIAALIPFLRKFIHGYHARQAFTRRVHLVWHIHDRDIGIAAETMLNEALDEDKLASGGILHITIFLDTVEFSRFTFGRRSVVRHGTPDYDDILINELEASDRLNYATQIAAQTSPVAMRNLDAADRPLTIDQATETDAPRLASSSHDRPEPGASKRVGKAEKLLVLGEPFDLM